MSRIRAVDPSPIPISIGSLVVLFWGCANQPVSYEVTPDHPASPRAREAPLPSPSMTLAVEFSDPIRGDAPGDTGAGAPSGAQAHFTCPMHSDVVADKPGPCPKCGMKLVKRAEQHPHEAGVR